MKYSNIGTIKEENGKIVGRVWCVITFDDLYYGGVLT